MKREGGKAERVMAAGPLLVARHSWSNIHVGFRATRVYQVACLGCGWAVCVRGLRINQYTGNQFSKTNVLILFRPLPVLQGLVQPLSFVASLSGLFARCSRPHDTISCHADVHASAV